MHLKTQTQIIILRKTILLLKMANNRLFCFSFFITYFFFEVVFMVEKLVVFFAFIFAASVSSAQEFSTELIADRLEEQGVFVQSAYLGGSPNIFGQRSGVLLTLDGVRFVNATFQDAPYLSLFNSFSLESLEIERGSRAVTDGNNALGGIIRLIPRRLEYEEENAGSITFIGDSFDNSVLIAPSVRWSEENTSIIVGASYGDHGLFRSGGGRELANSFYNQVGGYFRFGSLFGPRELTLSYYGSAVNNVGRYDQLDGGEFEQYSGENHFLIGRLIFEGVGIWQRVETTASLNVLNETISESNCQTAQINDLQDQEGDPVFTPITVDPEGCTERNFTSLTGQKVNFANSVSLVGSTLITNTFPENEQITLMWGSEIYETIVGSRAEEVRQPDFARHRIEPDIIDNSRIFQFDLHALAQYEQPISDNMRLLPTIGMRLAHYDATELNNDRNLTQFTNVYGSAGTSLFLEDITELYLSFNQGFRAPTLQETAQIDETLQAERSNNLELGTKLRFSTLDLDVSAFWLNISDPIEATYVAESASYTGAEAKVSTTDWRGLSLAGNIAWIEGDVTMAGETMPARRVPPLRYSAFLRYNRNSPFSDSSGSFFTSIGFRGAAAQTRLHRLDEMDLGICTSGVTGLLASELGENCSGSADWTTLDYKIGFSSESFGSIRLELRNLLDANYRYHGSGHDAPGFNAHFVANFLL